jgi:hypothetical protein
MISTSEWSSNARLVALAVMLGGSFGGCYTPVVKTKFESTTDLKNVAPVTRLVIFGSAGRMFGGSMNRGFEAGLTSRLATCGVATSIVHMSALDLDADARIAAVIAKFRASSVMSIATDGGLVERGLNGGLLDTLWFKLKLLDTTSSKAAWIAQVRFEVEKNFVSNDQGVGVRFATSIIARLRDDGILTRCPAPNVPWPAVEWPDEVDPAHECLQERRRILYEARHIDDKDERREKLNTLPSCQ